MSPIRNYLSIMLTHPGITKIKQPHINSISNVKRSDRLHHLTFDNPLQANIIFLAANGKPITASRVACNLLGYSKKELLTKNSADIIDVSERSFKKILKERKTKRYSIRLVTFIRKNGKRISCEVFSALFKDDDGTEKRIIAFTDTSAGILKQKKIDAKKEKVVADNIALVKSKQKSIDIKNENKVARNIALAKLKQINIDIKNAKKVARDIVIAISKQIKIDAKKEKIVADNIAYAKALQINIDIRNAKKVADDIVIAISKQIKIDAIKEKIVRDNILLAISKQKNIDAENAKTVARNIVLAISKQKTIDSKKEKIVAENIKLAQEKSDEEKINYEIAANENLLKEFHRNLKLASQSTDHLIRQLAFEKSVHPNLISTAEHGKIELVNKAACKLLGYSKKELLTKSRKDIVDIHEAGFKKMLAKRNAKGQSTGLVTFINRNGKRIPCEIFSAVFTDVDGIEKALISFTNLSRQNALQGRLNDEITAKEKLLIDNDKRFNLIFNSSSDVLYDSDLETGSVIISDAYEKEYGYKIKSHMTPMADWIEHIHPEDKEATYLDFQRMLASDDMEWKCNYRFLRASGIVANVLSKAIILRNQEGKAYRILGYMRDNSKQKVLEERLDQDIKLKEKQIEDAMREAKETERSEIGKELHDNVNQLLGASKLYLEMAKGGGKESEMYLKRSTEYTLDAIEEIRKLSKGLTTDLIKNLGLAESIENICRDTMETNPVKITYTFDTFIEESVGDKFKLNVFRIVQEQLNNILKHAKSTEVNINLSQNKKSVILTISDNGLGFDTTKKCSGIGLSNIKSRAASYKGTADIVSQPGRGCVLITTFPVIDSLASLN